jgi:hypothetical protein
MNDLRRWLDILTEADQNRRHGLGEASEKALRDFAAMYQDTIYEPGDPGYIDVNAARWREVQDYPLARLAHLHPDWKRYWGEEMSDELRKDHLQSMIDHDIREDIVVYDDGARGWIWDGWHRVAASFVVGRKTIPAVVGTRKLGSQLREADERLSAHTPSGCYLRHWSKFQIDDFEPAIGVGRDYEFPHLDVTFNLRPLDERTIVLQSLQSANPRSGEGRQGMASLCAAADRCHVSLLLVASPYETRDAEPMTREALMAWYGRFGFVPTGEPGEMLRNAR